MGELPEHLRPLADRARAVVEADERVRAAWLTGSLALGRGDAHSDLDIRVAVQGDLPWEELVDRISPTVLKRKLPGPGTVVTCVTPDWERFDLVLVPVEEALTRPMSGARLTLLDKDDLTERLPAPAPTAPRSPGPIAEEFLRVLGLTPVVLGRGEYLVGSDGVWLLRRMLVDLMLAENGDQDRGGVKRLNPFLTDAQRAALESLPPIAPTREAVIAGNLAIAALALPLARRVCGAAYPEALEAATLRHLQGSLGLTL